MPPGSGDVSAPSEKAGEKKEVKKVEKSYLASAVDSINPWTTNRSTTPVPKDVVPKTNTTTATKKADDHSTNTLYGQSFRRYPSDCPPLNVMWFHAADVSVTCHADSFTCLV